MLLLAIAGPLPSCAPDFKDSVGPRVPVDNVSGRAERDGTGATSLDVSVRNPTDNASIGSTKTDAGGYYAVAAPPGTWEVRIRGKVSGDFESVTRGFVISGDQQKVDLPPVDVFAYGTTLLQPDDSASLAVPTDTSLASFRWSRPTRPYTSARIQIFDSAGAAVWYSLKTTDSSATWDGRGNQGPYIGTAVPPAKFTWRLKFELPDSSEARTRSRTVLFR